MTTTVAVLRERAAAERLAQEYEGEWVVARREERLENEAPPAAYTTADLLEDAAARLGWNAAQTMKIAQSLFENGHITYPRTDSAHVSAEAREAAQAVIFQRYGAGEWGFPPFEEAGAHEAIRPSDPARDPDGLALDPQAQALYRLVWLRFLSAHMRPAVVKVVTVTLEKKEKEQV